MRWNARDIAAADELGVDEIVLSVDAPDAVPYRRDVVLHRDLGTVEAGVSLLEVDEIESAVIVAALVGVIVGMIVMVVIVVIAAASGAVEMVAVGCAFAGQTLKLAVDEAVVTRVVGRRVEAESSRCFLQSDFDSRRLFLIEERIADLERAGRFMHAFREELGCIGRAFDVLSRQPRDGVERQLVKKAETAADRRKVALTFERVGMIDAVVAVKILPADAVDRRALDAGRGLKAQPIGQAQFLEPETGDALGMCGLKQGFASKLWPRILRLPHCTPSAPLSSPSDVANA